MRTFQKHTVVELEVLKGSTVRKHCTIN